VEFNEKVVEWLKGNHAVKYVIISSPFHEYFKYGSLPLFYEGKKIDGDRSISIRQMVSTIELLRAYGKYPILIGPPPMAGFNVGECWERKKSGLVVLGRPDCSFGINEDLFRKRGVIEAINDIQKQTNVQTVYLDRVLCREERCKTEISGVSIYRDEAHLSSTGSEWVVPQLNLAERLSDRLESKENVTVY
jgi:hypothetical protein